MTVTVKDDNSDPSLYWAVTTIKCHNIVNAPIHYLVIYCIISNFNS